MSLGAVGLALFALHLVLLLALPPIPPIVNEFSLTSYLLGNVAALLVAYEALRTGPERIARGSAGGAGWRARAAVAVAAALGLALLVREGVPGVFVDLRREGGLFEPVSILAYAGGAALLWSGLAGPRGLGDPARRPWRLATAAFLLLALEELDWFGIPGGIIGRIDGVYAGAIHDLLRLATKADLSPLVWAAVLGIAVLLAAGLVRAGWLDARWLAARAREPAVLWLVAWALLVGYAAAEDAHVFGIPRQPNREEALEMAGALCAGLWAVEAVARHRRR